MPRGKKKSHKGGHRSFTNELDLQRDAERTRKEKEWRARQGLESESEEDEEEDESATSKPKAVVHHDDSSNESSDEESSEEESEKPKGIAHLIEVENPNRIKQKSKKITELDAELGGSSNQPSMSRREKEELEKQQSKERYQKLHEAGKTDEARADLARLALIRKQREEAAKKREDEKKMAELRLSDKKQKQ